MKLSLVDHIIGRVLSEANLPVPAIIAGAYRRSSDAEDISALEIGWPHITEEAKYRYTHGLGMNQEESEKCVSYSEQVEYHRKCEGIALQYLRHIAHIVELMEEDRARDVVATCLQKKKSLETN